MNNELFDRMIKDNLQEVQVAPSSEVKRALAWKLFFQNLLVFHKVKLVAGALLLSGVASYYIVNTNVTEETLLGSYILSNRSFVEVKETLEPEVNETVMTEIVVESFNESEENTDLVNNEIGVVSETSENVLIASAPNSDNNSSSIESDHTFVEVSETNEENAAVSTEYNKNSTDTENDFALIDNAIAENGDVERQSTIPSKLKELNLFLVEPKGISLESSENLCVPMEAEDWDIDLVPGVYKELSFDLYKGVLGQSEISSYLTNAHHRHYYWDFHGDDEVLNMNVLGGFNVNYTLGARVFRIKVNSGISYYTLNDKKAVYEFEEVTDPAWLDFFDTDELAWVDTYGEDTCTQCFYAHNTEELQKELEKEYNQYSYIKVPLKLGTQLNFKYVSLDILGGVDVNFLTNSKGLYVKEGLNPNYERFYYWDQLQLSTLSKDNDMLKKSFMTWSVSTNVRVRVTQRFDLFAGYQVNKSFGSLTKDDYLMNKKLKSSNTSVGITYYPFRTKLNPKF